jgi:hypothetical protein
MFTATLVRHPTGNGIQNHDTFFVVLCFAFGQHKHADTEFWHLHFPLPAKLGDLACSATSVQRKQNLLLQMGRALRQQPLFLVVRQRIGSAPFAGWAGDRWSNLQIRMSCIISPPAGAPIEDADQYGQFSFDSAGTDGLQSLPDVRLYGSVMKLRDL